MQTTHRKTIAFPEGVIQRIEIIASEWDMGFGDYIRYLATKDVDKHEQLQREKVYYMSDATEKAVMEGEKEYEAGNTKGFTDINKLMKYLTRKR